MTEPNENLQMFFFNILFGVGILVRRGVIVVTAAAHQETSPGKKSGSVSVTSVLHKAANCEK